MGVTNINGKKPNSDERKWLDMITQLGCIACLLHLHRFSPCEIHHTDGKDKHKKTIGLCFNHHREGSCKESHVSRHPYKRAFAARYGSDEELLTVTREMLGAGA